MEIDRTDHNAVSPNGGDTWFSSTGVGKNGQSVTLNFFADSEEEVAPLAHGLGIAHNVSMHQEAERIGTRQDYEDLSH
jgi:hypothetical protein